MSPIDTGDYDGDYGQLCQAAREQDKAIVKKPSELIEKLLVDIQPWLQVREELLDIMRAYDEQMAENGYVDTPGGLEHMGDVWNLLSGWRDMIK